MPPWDTFDIKVVKIQFWILHPVGWDPLDPEPLECTPPTTVADINAMLVELNAAFAPGNIQFDNIGFPVIEVADSLNRITCNDEYKQLLETYSTYNAIDVYFVDQILSQSCTCGPLLDICISSGGVSTITASDLQGVVIRHCGNEAINPCGCTPLGPPSGCGICDEDPSGEPQNCGIETPKIFIHEMGHYFDLLHPHATGYGIECPSISEANCSTCGDFLCGTSAEPAPETYDKGNFCNAINVPDPPDPPCDLGVPYQPPDLTNYMNNKGPAALCRNHFTRGQLARARATLLNLRAGELW